MDKKLTIITSVVAGLIVLALVSYVGYTVYNSGKTTDNATTTTKTTTTTTTTTKGVADCKPLVSDDKTAVGKAPYSPVLRAKLIKNSTTTKPVCMWSLDDKLLHLSVPVSGNCVYSGVPIYGPGTYKIGLSVEGTDCTIDKTVTVTQ